MTAVRRLNKEFQDLNKNPLGNISAGPIKENIFKWEATIIGPVGTPYEGGVFRIAIDFTTDYPFRAPKCNFMTRVFHPNINAAGCICLDILKDQWSASLTLSKLLLSICSLLNDPNPDDPLDSEAANVFKKNREEYNRIARQYTANYAN